MTIDADKRINVTFSSNITSFSDWFPSICTNHSDYVNEYMFDGAQKWNIHNLIVEEYDSGNGYGLIRTENVHGDITCHSCSIVNITNTDSDHTLFETYGSFHFHHSNFIEIIEDIAMIRGINNEDDDFLTGSIREFLVEDCNFTDFSSSTDMIKLLQNYNDVK